MDPTDQPAAINPSIRRRNSAGYPRLPMPSSIGQQRQNPETPLRETEGTPAKFGMAPRGAGLQPTTPRSHSSRSCRAATDEDADQPTSILSWRRAEGCAVVDGRAYAVLADCERIVPGGLVVVLAQ